MPIQHFPLETTNCTPSPSIRITNGTECKVLIAITVPTRNWKYIFKVRTDILIGELRKQAIETYNLKELDFINYGLYLPPESGKKGKFLQDERTISEYPQLVAMKLNPYNDNQLLHEIESNGLMNDRKSKEPVVLELLPKIRFVEEYRLEGSKSTTKRIHSKHHQKRLLSAIKRNDIGRVTDLLEQGLDPNFQYPSSGVIPLGCAAELTDPREMILQLVNAGAHLDYRDSDTMTALHRAAINGNLKAIEVFLELGQNPNVRDKNDLTPLYYACSEDIQPECIQRLLFDHAILGVTDDKGRQEIHQACLNGRSKTLKQLIIYGADLNAQVENHNTPLHLCVLADEMDCLNLLLRYGASPTSINLSGQTPYELAILIERMNLANILQNFDEHLVEGIDQKPVYNKDRRPTIHGPRAVYDSVHLLQYNHNSNHSNSNNNNNNNNNGNTISTRKLSKPMSIDRELPPTPYQRCLSFDMNDLRQLTPKRINQYVFHNNKIESGTPDIVRRNNLDKKEATINNNRPLLPIRRQMTYSNDNDHCGGTIYNDNNPQDILKFPRRLNFLRQRYPNYRIRSIILERGITGYGFIMQGSDNFKERSFIANNLPSQRILSVQPNSKAENAGLVPGDYILEINGMDVYDATHTQVVDLITTTRDMLQLKIINFQQLPEIQSRVINGNHGNSNNNTTTNSNNSIITNTNLNYSNNNTRIMHRTSFLRADLRRRNTQRSTSVDMAWNTRQLSIDNNTMDNNHNITTTTTTNNNNNNNNYRRSIQSLNTSKANYLERKSQSVVLIIKDETEQLKDSSRTTTTTAAAARPLSTTLSSSSLLLLSPSISSSSSSLSPHINNTYTDITNFNDSSNYNNQLECHISKSSNLLLSNELKNSELDRSTITPTITTLHNELTNRQDKYKFTMKSLSSLTTTTTTTTSPSSLSSSSSSFSAQHLLYLSSSSLSSKYKQDNKMMNTLKQYHNDTSDHKWDSESDLLNISEITEISVISMNGETLNNNIDKAVEYKKQSNFIKPTTINILTPSLMSSTSTSTTSSSSPVKNKLINKVNFHMNGKLRSIQSEPYLYQMKAEANNGNNKNNYNNHSCNDIKASTEQKAPINNNLKINGHEIDDDESDSCLI